MNRFARTLAVSALTVVAAIGAGPVAAVEPAPANDAMADATVIGALPFTDTISTVGATTVDTDPGTCFFPEFGPDEATVWYTFTATETGPLGATTFGSDYDTTLYVGTANGAGGIDVIGCSDDTRTHQSAVRFDAVAGETYVFAIGGTSWSGLPTSGTLVFNLDLGPVAQDASLTVDPVVTFERGSAVFRGTVGCTAETTLGSLLVVELRQYVGERESAAGTAFLDIEGCPGGEIPFEVAVPNEWRHFHPGTAMAQVIYAACNHFECANEVIDLEVTIAP